MQCNISQAKATLGSPNKMLKFPHFDQKITLKSIDRLSYQVKSPLGRSATLPRNRESTSNAFPIQIQNLVNSKKNWSPIFCLKAKLTTACLNHANVLCGMKGLSGFAIIFFTSVLTEACWIRPEPRVSASLRRRQNEIQTLLNLVLIR